MSDSNISQTATKLKVFALVADSYRVVFGNLSVMTRILWLPIALLVAMSYRFEAQKGTAEMQTQWGAFLDPMYLLYLVVYWVVMTGAYVSLHRFVLLGTKQPALGFTFEKRELRYLGYSIAILTILMLPIGVLVLLESVLPQVLGFVIATLSVAVMIGICIGIVRLGLVMPAISLDQAGGLQWHFQSAWALAKGNTFRILMAQIVALLPFVLVTWIWPEQTFSSVAEQTATGTDRELYGMITTVILNVVSWLSTAVFIVLYSIAYRSLKQQVKS